MARASSIISVSIIGDARKLVGAVGEANTATGGMLGTFAKIGIASIAVSKGFDLINDSLKESDRLGDAMARLSSQLTPETAQVLANTADSFTRIGASTQDMLELEAIFADFATTAGIADPTIAGMAESVAATATALTLTDDQGRDASAMLDLLTKASTGSEKAARELGVTLIDGASSADQMRNILSQLNPKLVDATTGSQDLEAKQKTLGATMETFGAVLGTVVEGPLTDLLDIVIKVIEDVPRLVGEIEDLATAIIDMTGEVLTPLARLADLLGFIFQDRGAKFTVTGPGIGTGTGIGTNGTGKGTGIGTDRGTTKAVQREQERNGLQTGMGVP